MTMSNLKRRIVDLDGDRYWALYGLRGIVDFNVVDFAEYGTHDVDSRAFVGMHSPHPHENDEGPCGRLCPFLEGACHFEVSDGGGEFIAGFWEESGFNDEVIWRWLEDYYNEALAATA